MNSKIKAIIAILSFLAPVAVLSAHSAQPAAPNPLSQLHSTSIDSLGHPRLIWENLPDNGNAYDIQRRVDKAEFTASCQSSNVTEDGWCNVVRSKLSTLGNFTVFTDNEVRVDPAYPDEYQYRIAVRNNGGISDYSSVWASNCAESDSGYSARVNWVNSVNEYPLLSSSSSSPYLLSVNDIPAATEKTVHTSFLNGDYHFLSNDKYVALFSRYSGLIGLTHRAYGSEFIDVKRTPYRSSWVIRLNDRDADNSVDIDGSKSSPDSTSFDEVTGTLSFIWNNEKGLKVQTNWSLESYGRTGLHSSINVTGTAVGADVENKGIEYVRFPVITGFGYPYVTMYRPDKSFGFLDSKFPMGSSYPARSRTTQTPSQRAQFIGFSNTANTKSHEMMYFATEDPHGEPKTFRVQPHVYDKVAGITKNTSATELYLYPMDGTGVPGNSVTMGYDLVMAPMCGGWARIAKRYRRFALDQDWVKVPRSSLGFTDDPDELVRATIDERTDIPEAIRKGVFWWVANNGPDADLTRMRRYMNDELKKFIGPGPEDGGVNVGMHFYNWHSPGFDTNYPEFEQRFYCGTDREVTNRCQITMPEVIADVQADGTVVMPYINATHSIISDRCHEPTVRDRQCGQSAAAGAPDGSWGWWTRSFFLDSTQPEVPDNVLMRKLPKKRNTSEPGIGVTTYDFWFGDTSETFARMNLSTPFWQRVVETNVNNVFSFGARGVYLDTLGGGYAPDYSELHGYVRPYPLGHSNFWKDASLQIANRAQQLGDTAEQQHANNQYGKRFTAAEHFNELYMRDIDVFTIYSEQPVNLIPLIPAIYGDYQIFAGPQVRKDDSKQARSYRLARGFIWGSQLGLVQLAHIQGLPGNKPRQFNVFADCLADYEINQGCDIPNIRYARALASSRSSMSHIFSGGEFIDVVESIDKTTVSDWCVDNRCNDSETGDFDRLQASRWLTTNNEKVIVITNPNPTTTETSLRIPENWRQLNVACFDAGSTNSDCVSGVASELVTVSLDAHETRYLVFSE